ncbi:exonuclease, partial [Escherichia coli EC1856]
ERSGLT